jgi:hypothetical protein
LFCVETAIAAVHPRRSQELVTLKRSATMQDSSPQLNTKANATLDIALGRMIHRADGVRCIPRENRLAALNCCDVLEVSRAFFDLPSVESRPGYFCLNCRHVGEKSTWGEKYSRADRETYTVCPACDAWGMECEVRLCDACGCEVEAGDEKRHDMGRCRGGAL